MKQSLVDKVYEDMKRQILCLQYGANEMITEMAIAEKYGVSKTPAREALNRLCVEGYIVRYPSSGYFIKDISIQDHVEISELRIVLESEAVRLIARRATDEEIMQLYEIISRPIDTFIEYHDVNTDFHAKLGELSHNSYLRDMIVMMVNANARPSMFRRFTDEVKPHNTFHRAIADCLMKRDAEGAMAAIVDDLFPKSLASVAEKLKDNAHADAGSL